MTSSTSCRELDTEALSANMKLATTLSLHSLMPMALEADVFEESIAGYLGASSIYLKVSPEIAECAIQSMRNSIIDRFPNMAHEFFGN